MKTYPDYFDGKQLSSFAIDNIYISIQNVVKLLKKVDGVTIIRCSKALMADVRIEFTYFDIPFIVEEPYGDNSWYWIGPENGPAKDVDVSLLENVFILYNPPLYQRLIGDLLTFRFLRWFRHD